jgi:hypothetical protein
LRHFLQFQRSTVNDALKQALIDDPEYFWHSNNGVTIICDSAGKSLAGAPGRELGLFNREGVSVVNGAQTVGIIGATIGEDGVLEGPFDESARAWVQVRIISLKNCPPGLAREITKAANFQDSVGERDFAAMDPVQHALATDMALDRRKYIYKSGEADPRGDEGCSITEATQALGCAHSIASAVQVKREISRLWLRTDAKPCTDLFNSELTATKVWRHVCVMRVVDDELQKLKRTGLSRADMVAIHPNRVVFAPGISR